jgi:hypothetical protein
MTPEWRVPLVPDCRISIILATFDPDLLAIVVFDDNECAISARTALLPHSVARERQACFAPAERQRPGRQAQNREAKENAGGEYPPSAVVVALHHSQRRPPVYLPAVPPLSSVSADPAGPRRMKAAARRSRAIVQGFINQ